MNQNSLVAHWNPDENFWAINPAFKSVKIFRELFEADKTKGKAHSSKLMWAIAYYVDLHESNVWKNVSDSEKKKLIAEDYLGNTHFDFEDIEVHPLVEEYENRVLTIAQKELRRYEKKLSQRGDFLEKTTYTMDEYDDNGKIIKGTATQLDKMMVDSGKIFDQLANIKAKLEKEDAEGALRGGAAESVGETGAL
jgi:hypothetical protein